MYGNIAIVKLLTVVLLQVLLGSHHAAPDGGKSNHHSRGHHLLQRRAHAAVDRLQRGFRHLLPHGPGAELPHGNREGGQRGDHSGPSADQDQISALLVRGGLHLLHPRGLHLPHCGDTHRFRFLQDGARSADRTLHEDPQSAAAAAALAAHTLHSPVGGGEWTF